MSRPGTGTGQDEVTEQVRDSAHALGQAEPLQRVLLTTDGTVVRLLEGFFEEKIRASDVVQETAPAASGDEHLELSGDERVLRRSAVLEGAVTRRRYVYAEASVVLDRVPGPVRTGLLAGSEPIGRLLVAERVETFREIVASGRRTAGPAVAQKLGLGADGEVLFRTYRIILRGAPAMLITEYFPPSYVETTTVHRPEDNGKAPAYLGRD